MIRVIDLEPSASFGPSITILGLGEPVSKADDSAGTPVGQLEMAPSDHGLAPPDAARPGSPAPNLEAGTAHELPFRIALEEAAAPIDLQDVSPADRARAERLRSASLGATAIYFSLDE